MGNRLVLRVNMQKIGFIDFGLLESLYVKLCILVLAYLESIYAENRVYWLWPHWRLAC